MGLREKLDGFKHKKDIQLCQLSIFAYVMLRVTLEKLENYLTSEEFQQASEKDRLLLIVDEAFKRGLPLYSENLAQIYSALPATIPGGVLKSDISIILLPLRSVEAISAAFRDERVKEFVQSDEFQHLSKIESLKVLLKKIHHLGYRVGLQHLKEIRRLLKKLSM